MGVDGLSLSLLQSLLGRFVYYVVLPSSLSLSLSPFFSFSLSRCRGIVVRRRRGILGGKGGARCRGGGGGGGRGRAHSSPHSRKEPLYVHSVGSQPA